MDSANRKTQHQTQGGPSPRLTAASDWLRSGILRLLAANIAPISSRVLAKELRRDRGAVAAVAATLAADGLILREGRGWVAIPAGRCEGMSVESGERCGRLAVIGSRYCTMHSSPEPTWRFEWEGWSIARARQMVLPAGKIASVLDVYPDALDWPLKELRDLVVREFYPLGDDKWADLRIELATLQIGEEAHRWLELHDPEWIAAFDRGDVERPQPKRPRLQTEINRELRTDGIREPKPRSQQPPIDPLDEIVEFTDVETGEDLRMARREMERLYEDA